MNSWKTCVLYLIPVILAGGCAQATFDEDDDLGMTAEMPIDSEPTESPMDQLNDADELFQGVEPASFDEEEPGMFRTQASDGVTAYAANAYSLEAFDTPIRSQGSRGWCTAFATVAAIENSIKRGFQVAEDLSEIAHWSSYARANMFYAVAGATQTSLVPEAAWPYYGNPIANYKSQGVVRVTAHKQLGNKTAVLNSIINGKPVVIGINVNASWKLPGRDGRIASNGPFGGGHAMMVVGFQSDASYGGGGYMRIKNSWGARWGDLGYARMPYDYCVNSRCYFIELSNIAYKERAPAPNEPAPSAPDTSDSTFEVAAQHDPANGAKFKLYVKATPSALAKVKSVVYDVHETFGKWRYSTVTNPNNGFQIPTYYTTVARHWRTNGATVVLNDGRSLRLNGAVISW